MFKFKNIVVLLIMFSLIFIYCVMIQKSNKQNDIQFNNGICINCGNKLEPSGIDKYYNVMWICNNCGYKILH